MTNCSSHQSLFALGNAFANAYLRGFSALDSVQSSRGKSGIRSDDDNDDDGNKWTTAATKHTAS